MFVNVCTHNANVVCYWMAEDCFFRQDWNLQLNNWNNVNVQLKKLLSNGKLTDQNSDHGLLITASYFETLLRKLEQCKS